MVFSETRFFISRPRLMYSSIKVLMNSTIFVRLGPVMVKAMMEACLLTLEAENFMPLVRVR